MNWHQYGQLKSNGNFTFLHLFVDAKIEDIGRNEINLNILHPISDSLRRIFETNWIIHHKQVISFHSVAIFLHQKIPPFTLKLNVFFSSTSVYWLGGRFESNKHLKWNDGSNITFKVEHMVHILFYFIFAINIVNVNVCVCVLTSNRDGYKVSDMPRKLRRKHYVSVYRYFS